MASLAWNRSLSIVLGPELNDSSGDAIKRLVEDQIAERIELDFKREVYGSSKDDARELAFDVAAMANAVGGVILLGVDEQDSVASALVPIDAEKRDSELLRIHEIIAQRVAPVPVVYTEWVKIDSGGVIAIVIPPSRGAPHAVGRDGSPTNRFLCWPRRDGIRKRYLSEFEIADAYSVRARQVRSDLDRLREVLSDVEKLRDMGLERVWITGALVPSLPGSFQLSEWDRDRILRELAEPWINLPDEQRPSRDIPDRFPRLRRLRMVSGSGVPTDDMVSEVHWDGSVASAACVSYKGRASRLTEVEARAHMGPMELPDQWVFVELCRVLGALTFLSTSVAGARGTDSTLRIELNAEHALLGRFDNFDRFARNGESVGEHLELERTIDLDSASDSAGYGRLLGSVAADIWNGMGWQTCPYVTVEGEVTATGRELIQGGIRY